MFVEFSAIDNKLKKLKLTQLHFFYYISFAFRRKFPQAHVLTIVFNDKRGLHRSMIANNFILYKRNYIILSFYNFFGMCYELFLKKITTVCMYIIIKRRIKHMNYTPICMLASKDGSNESSQHQFLS